MKHIFSILILLLFINCTDKRVKEHHKDLENQAEKNHSFVWDFSQPKKFIYSFEQTVKGSNKMERDGAANKSYLSGVGSLNVMVNENQLADLSITNLEIKMVLYNEDDTPKDSITSTAPTNVIQGMKPNGNFDDANSDILFDLLFPLPAVDLKKGQSDKIAMQMPFNAFGSQLKVKGFNTLTFSGYDTIDGYKCAVFRGDIAIDQLEVPEALKGEFISATTGSATYYFNVQDRYYVGADINMLMKFKINPLIEDTQSFNDFAQMESDNTYKIRLVSIEQ